MGSSSVLCLLEEEQGGCIFYKYSGFLHTGLDWAGWASHAGTSQPGGWGVTMECTQREWRRRSLPLRLEPVLVLAPLVLNQPFNQLVLPYESSDFINACNNTEHMKYSKNNWESSLICKFRHLSRNKFHYSEEYSETSTSPQTRLLLRLMPDVDVDDLLTFNAQFTVFMSVHHPRPHLMKTFLISFHFFLRLNLPTFFTIHDFSSCLQSCLGLYGDITLPST